MKNLHSYRALDLTWSATPPPRAGLKRIVRYGLMVATFLAVVAA